MINEIGVTNDQEWIHQPVYADSIGTYQTTMKMKSPDLTGTIDSTKQFDSMDVVYTIAVSLSSMVVITVIAILVICIIKRRRQNEKGRILKELSPAKNDTTELGVLISNFIS